jgi:dCMP deaminase
MLGATMYQACIDAVKGGLAEDIDSCQMCKKLIINAGIERVVYRETADTYRVAEVGDWIRDDDSLGKVGY